MKKGESSGPTPKAITKSFSFWQDRDIRFDSQAAVLKLRENTEVVYAMFTRVEDTKGNNGNYGVLLVTNLRIIWWNATRKSINLSIGYYCIQSVTVQETQSKLAGGTAEAVTLSTKYGASRFQFLFSVVHGSTGNAAGGPSMRQRLSSGDNSHQRLYTAIHEVWRAYESSRVYRELRVRSAVVQDGNIVVLPGETVISRTSGVSNVSKDEGHLGHFVVTNVRVVWFAAEESFNVSVPYLQFVGLRSQGSKFGQTLVIETSTYAGSFTLGFRVDPTEKLAELYLEVSTLWRTWTVKPVLGIQVALHDESQRPEKRTNLEGESELELNAAASLALQRAREASGYGSGDDAASRAMTTSAEQQPPHRMEGQDVVREVPAEAFAAYYADEGNKGADRRPVFEPSIGLAVEKLRKGATMQSLWDLSLPF